MTDRDIRVFVGTGTMDAQADVLGWRRLAGPMRSLATLLSSAKAVKPLISVEQAVAAEWLEHLHSALAATETTLNANITSDVQVPAFDHAISFALLTIGDWVFGTLINLPFLSSERTQANLRIVFGQARMLETYVFRTDNPSPMERLTADYERHATRPGAFAIDNMLLNLAGED